MAPSSSSSSPQLRKDKINNKWVIFSPARSKRPTQFKSKSPVTGPDPSQSPCPFCAGQEHHCAPEIFRVGYGSGSGSDWRVRVIENLYPAVSREVEGFGSGSDEVQAGFGFHDVVIESPKHGVGLGDLEDSDVWEVVLAYKKRVLQIASVESIQYVQVFKNHGATAGASMSHSHSQIIALPIIPPSVSTRLEAMKAHFDQTGKCILCEAPSKELLIDESKHFISIVPFAASYAFEVWIIPLDHSSHFHDIDEEKALELGSILKLTLMKIKSQLNDPPFNFMIQTSPLKMNDSKLIYSHWFLQIVPQLSHFGGFELGTGCYINPVFPEDAAKVLRDVNVDA